MRKQQQLQILNLLATLEEAHGEITRLMAANDSQALTTLLADCQAVAIHIGGTVEQLEGEGTKTVAWLEAYCETAYRLNNTPDNSPEADEQLAQMRDQLGQIKLCVQSELRPDKFEILFLPYKASMFDCMESVWRAAAEDPQCDVHVVPIPYYERQAEGALGQMYCEADQFPSYVPVESWEQYDLEGRRPDVIVIHNPYDEANFVTSVHPAYYSTKLRQHTDLLVYIPYFVADGTVEESYCVQPGVLNAHKVVVQSAPIREIYIQALKNHDPKATQTDLQNKVVALGSPKFDKVLCSKPEDFELPTAWKANIEAPKGQHKKVILYNTSITGLLRGNEESLTKMKDVLDYFKNRDDVVLLWRPHPLNESSVRAMREELLTEYEGIVAGYKQHSNGIYDDTADLSRAMALADAYYGDNSSLVPLFLSTGKPLMLENLGISNKGGKRPVLETLYDDGEALWFAAYGYNALFRMDKETLQPAYVGSFPGEKAYGQRLYSAITSCNGKLYFAPGSAREIAEYDPAAGAFHKFPIPPLPGFGGGAKNTSHAFRSMATCNGRVFLAGFTYPGIVELNPATGETIVHTSWLQQFKKKGAGCDGVYFRSICTDGSRLAAAAFRTNAVVEIDTKSGAATVHPIETGGQGFSSICFDGTHFWLAPRGEGPVIRWRPDENANTYSQFPKGYEPAEYSRIQYAAGYVWMLPQLGGSALKIDIRDGSMAPAEPFQSICELDKPGANFYLVHAEGDMLYTWSGKEREFCMLDCATGEVQKAILQLTAQDAERLTQSHIVAFDKGDPLRFQALDDCIFYEQAAIALDDFIHFVVHPQQFEEAALLSEKQKELCGTIAENADGTAGAKIYAHLKAQTLR